MTTKATTHAANTSPRRRKHQRASPARVIPPTIGPRAPWPRARPVASPTRCHRRLRQAADEERYAAAGSHACLPNPACHNAFETIFADRLGGGLMPDAVTVVTVTRGRPSVLLQRAMRSV